MPLIKIGRSYYNGEERPIYLLQGAAVRDAEDAPLNGKPHAKVSVAAVSNPDESTTFVTVNGWRERAEQVASILKMDSVLAVGPLKKREYNGREYYDLDADFVVISGARLANSGAGSGPPPSTKAHTGPGSFAFAELDDVDNGDLPF